MTSEVHKGRRLLAMAALGAALIVSTCSSTPTLEEWASDWRTALDQVPSIESVLATEGTTRTAICNKTVGQLRETAVEIERSPNADIKHAALGYVDFAEAVFFDCPIQSGEHAGFAAGYEEMDRLATIVDTLIAFEVGQGREPTN